MVKNTKGGNKAKKQARKSGNTPTTKTRCSDHPDELYACVGKMLGNGMCTVLCIDGVERNCVIRNKFRGKGKRGNIMTPGVWCLVGRRDFEKPRLGKLEKTDLLEVYGEAEKKYIMQTETGLKDKWKQFNTLGTNFNESVDDESVNFNTSEFPTESGDDEEDIDETATDLGNTIDINDI